MVDRHGPGGTGETGPETARKTWATLEPLHAMIYFSPEATAAYAELGLTGASGYFASRSAALGAVPACDDLAGRPLFAAHAHLPWPDEPHLVLWHAQTLLREYRGDGHVAALVAAGLSGIEAFVTHEATGDPMPKALRASRGWPEDRWRAAADGLRERGWLADGPEPVLSADGARWRAEVERVTDERAAAPYAHLGVDACAELRALARPLARAVRDHVIVGPSPPAEIRR